MPTQGSYDPVLTVEKLWLDKDGRGLNVHADNAVFHQATITNAVWVSSMAYGATGLPGRPSTQVLAATSSLGWLKITWISGTSGGGGVGYIPVYSGNIMP
jgi:hypothetical protein